MTRASTTVGIVHPGSMGAAVAGQLRRHGVNVLWNPVGRSRATVERAKAHGLEAVDGLSTLLARVDLVIALCPPAAAEDIARQVAAHGFAEKIYVDANAIAPQRVRRIAQLLPDSIVVDAAVVGSPPVGGKHPKLYVSGSSHGLASIEDLFATTDVRVLSLGKEIGRASALKLAYTSYQKASRVLAAVAYGLADANGVADELLDLAGQRTRSYLTEPDYIPKTAARAWRWAPELEDAADLLAESGLPDRFMRETAAVLRRWDDVRDRPLSVTQALELLSAAETDGPEGTVEE
ncbi:DUF1932 domain-containing protein [Streptomyces sp. NBC_00322]|uniref:NAD(P)-dependent oxidoreductase n=1 Tax=Streptomyces sp. NBC_00322 TaxID=2975712 RepID=UPI002E2B47AF|nr:DUF1932 domain-containing protein [Streptomyces sp. NBC_00322]